MDKNEIISRIGYFRNKAKLSQKALSIEIDSKKDFLPSLDVLLKIIKACGVTVEEFFYEDIYNHREDKYILSKLKELPYEKREALLKLL